MVELIWDGKYDARGRRVAPSRLRLPFQTVETVNESAELRQRSLFGGARETGWRNRLIWGDKKYVLPALLDEFAGQVDLIYIDPPFATGSDFSFQVEVEDEQFTKEASIIEQKAYRDTWGRGLDSYLTWFYETSLLLHELLRQSGSVYIHLDYHVSHYAKALLDEIFGSNAFQNEICWKRATSGSAKARAKKYGADHDVLLFYSKGGLPNFKPVYVEYPESEINKRFRQKDERGHYKDAELGTYSQETFDRLKNEGRLIVTSGGKYRYKIYLDEIQGVLADSVWTDIPIVNSQAQERLNYPTQKPEALLERIIQASSNEGDLILDCFCGSGTTAAVAERLGRRWIAADLGRFAVHTTRKRLLGMAEVRPFVVQNLGKYERQAWQTAEFGLGPEGAVRAAEINQAYRRFILDLYGAREIPGTVWLHGAKGGRMVHVGPVDSPITPGDVTQIAIEFRKAMGTGRDAPTTAGVDVLGWDFAFELNEVARQQAEAARLDVRFVRIPREVLEKKAVEQGDIRFFELAALAVDVAQAKRDVTLRLTDFVIPPDDVPEDVQRAISHWSQWIDYWAVDWDNKGDTFHNMWQAYRTRGKKKGGEALQLQTTHRYEEAGEYTIMVKVIDILGNDTTKTVRVAVV